MESYGVCVSARETDRRDPRRIPALASLSHSHKLHKIPSHSHVPQSAPDQRACQKHSQYFTVRGWSRPASVARVARVAPVARVDRVAPVARVARVARLAVSPALICARFEARLTAPDGP